MPPRVEPRGADLDLGGPQSAGRRRASRWRRFINPDAADFMAPENMPRAIADFCAKTGQTRSARRRGRAALRAWTASP